MARSQYKTISTFEALETRTMMSAAPMVQVEAVAKKAPAITVATKAKQAAKLIDPTTTESDITYQSFANDPLFSSNGPTMSDVNQGYLGDCYLLSTLATVANTDPALIRKDIVADGNGTFTVTFGAGKTPQQININADLPVWGNGTVAYAGLGQQDSLWVALMEKAYVIYASPKTDAYNSIQGGWMSSAFSALGLTSKSMTKTANANSLAMTLQTDLKAGDFTTFGTQSNLPDNSPLIASHAYQVVSVNTDASGHSTVTLRNPWGDAVADDGIITVTAAQAFSAFAGVVVAHA